LPAKFFPPLFTATALFTPGQAFAGLGGDAAASREISRMSAQFDELEAQFKEAEQKDAYTQGTDMSGNGDPALSASGGPRFQLPGAPVTTQPARIENMTFKPRGRLQLDSNSISHPAGIDAPTPGWSADVRRAYLGVEGKLGGDFGYRLEVDVATGSAQFTDAWLTYGKGPLTVTLGHHRITSLEDVTSDLDTSMLERAAFTQAFGMERRLGLSASYGVNNLFVNVGIFADDAETLRAGGASNSYSADGRLVYMPRIDNTQLHFGGSLHHRELNDLTSVLRYRARPGARTTDLRFVDTGLISATAETGYGLEFAAVHGPVHVAMEGFWQRVARPGLTAPTFFGGYGEIGYVFAGGAGRPYKKGVLGTVVPVLGLNKGGAGAWQVNFRHDWLNLRDRGINGGTQRIFGASLVWVPVEYVKFIANYLRVEVRDTPVLAGGRSDYGANVFGLRAQYHF